MWRSACPLLTGIIAIGLVLTKRRLNEAKAELDRVRAQAAATGGRADQAGAGEVAGPVGQNAMSADREMAGTAADGPDLSSEWEQAVPPMDS